MNNMDNSIKTGQYILEVLNDSAELTALLGKGKIFPIVAKEGTKYPLVVYSRDQVQVQYTKVVGHDNTIFLTYRVYSDDYDQTLEIANTIRNILERKTITIPNIIKINDIRILSLQEAFTEDGFCQILQISTMVE